MPVGSYSYRNVDYERDLKKDQEPVSVYQDIDPAILRLLGLTDVFDLDYSTYKTLLKEAMVKGRMPKTEIPNEEVELLTNEWRKVKSSTGRFKIKKKTVKVSPLFSKPESIVGSKIDPVKMLPGSVQDPVEESREDKKERKERESEESIFNSIFNSLNNIYTTLKSAFKSDKKNAADAADEKELKRRQSKESFMEGFKKFVANTAKKALQPAVNILKKILDGIKLVLLGWVLNNLIDWLGDEENRENVNAVTEFLSKNFLKLIALWTAISLAGGVGVLVKLGGTILAGVTKLMWSLGKALVAAGIRNPLTALAIGGTVAAGAGIYGIGKALGKDKVVENETKRADTSREALEEAESTKDLSAGDREAIVQGTRLKDAGGGGSLNTMPDQFNDPLGLRNDPTGMGGMRLNQGGQVPGSGNSDSVSAKLTPGEFVVSAPAVQQWGADTFAAMNAMGGGGNTGSILRGFSEGGMVPFPEGSYKGQSGQKWGDPRDYGGHVGIDVTEDPPYESDPARPIYAPVKSKVLSEKFQRSGYTAGLMLDHLDGFQSRYVHMNPMKKPGDEIEPGDQIGKLKPLGRPPTWNSTHLHFELYKGSKLLNPTDFYKSLVDGSYQPSIARGVGDLNEVSSGEGGAVADSKPGGTWWNPFSWGKKSAATADNRKKGSASKGSSNVDKKIGGSSPGLLKALEGVEIPALKKYMNEEGGYDMDVLLGKKPSLSVPRPPNKPSTTVAYDRTMQDMVGGGQIPTRQSLPQIDASAMISRPKISTLGISV